MRARAARRLGAVFGRRKARREAAERAGAAEAEEWLEQIRPWAARVWGGLDARQLADRLLADAVAGTL